MTNKALDLDLEFEEEVEKKTDELDIVDLDFAIAPAKNESTNKASAPEKGNVVDLSQAKKNPGPPKVNSDEKTNPNLVIPKELNEDIDLDDIHQKNNNEESNAVTNLTPHPSTPRPSLKSSNPISEVKKNVEVIQESAPLSRPQNAVPSMPKSGQELDELQALREQLMQTREDAARRIALAEFKTEFLLDILVETKNMDSKINQALNQIFKKAPATKNEILMIKKVLLEYVQKVEKKKGK
jgi:hypothetical protein